MAEDSLHNLRQSANLWSLPFIHSAAHLTAYSTSRGRQVLRRGNQLLRWDQAHSYPLQFDFAAHIRRLRQKIEPDLDRPAFLLTMTDVGFRLRAIMGEGAR